MQPVPPLPSARPAEQTRRLSRLWVGALALVGMLALAGQGVVQRVLLVQEGDAEVVNLAGRQRMLSQRISKRALLLRADPTDAPIRRGLRQDLEAWTEAHERLEREMADTAAGSQLRALGPHFERVREAAFDLLDGEETPAASVDELLEHAEIFLGSMDGVVASYAIVSDRRVRRLRAVEGGLIALMLAVLVGEGLLLFRPTLRRLRESLAQEEETRDALAASEADKRAILAAMPDRLYRVGPQGTFFPIETGAERDEDEEPRRLRLEAAARALGLEPGQGGAPRQTEVRLERGRQVDHLLLRVAPTGGPSALAIVEDMSERLRLEAELVRIRADERRRLGRDLHDGLGQQLAGIAFLLEAWRARLRSGDAPDDEEMGVVIELIGQTRSQTRALAGGLQLLGPSGQGLTADLRELAEQLRTVFAVPVDLEIDLPSDPPAQIGEHLLRIAGEAATNALRHSGCSKILLRGRAHAEGLELCVEDDGAGLPPIGERGEGLGLGIMGYRARQVGARLDLSPGRDGLGTRVCCLLPTAPPDEIEPKTESPS